ncbi:hypothetical protein ACHAXR_005182 [Thalassiosira sp. AJA248-18]
MTATILVVGATGATGKHVVLQLLQQKHNVRAIARSKERLLNSLDEIEPESSANLHIVSRLDVTEASLLDLSEDELEKITRGCDAVVSCLGHNMSFRGLFFPPRRLVTDAAKRLCQAIEATNESPSDKPTKFILMGSDGVANPAGGDDKRRRSERAAFSLLRHLIPPHKDNELAAAYISSMNSPKIEWTVVRPTDLINAEKSSKYELFDKPQKGLFSGAKEGITTRANVAKCMVDMILTVDLWEAWKFKMPVVHDDLEGDREKKGKQNVVTDSQI